MWPGVTPHTCLRALHASKVFLVQFLHGGGGGVVPSCAQLWSGFIPGHACGPLWRWGLSQVSCTRQALTPLYCLSCEGSFWRGLGPRTWQCSGVPDSVLGGGEGHQSSGLQPVTCGFHLTWLPLAVMSVTDKGSISTFLLYYMCVCARARMPGGW